MSTETQCREECCTHTAFWNTNGSDFLCPNKEEHIFGAGGEMTNWMQVPGYGYHVQRGDKIRIETMVHNPTDTSHDKAYLQVRIPFQEATGGAGATLKSCYPAWMDVKSFNPTNPAQPEQPTPAPPALSAAGHETAKAAVDAFTSRIPSVASASSTSVSRQARLR
jgi:hypothetical protein